MPGAAAWCGYASSLSKTVAPGLRIGWIVAPPPVTNVITRIKQALDLHTSSFTQEIAARYLESGALEQRLSVTREAYATQCETLCSALSDSMSNELTFSIPDGGMFLWCRFREPIDTTALLEHARQRGVIFVPGSAFYPGGNADTSTLRLSFSSCSPGELREGVRRLESALRAYRDCASPKIEAFRSHSR